MCFSRFLSCFLCIILHSDNNDDLGPLWSTEPDRDEVLSVVFLRALSRSWCRATTALPSPWADADYCSWKPALGRQLVDCSQIFLFLCMLCSCLVVTWAVCFFLGPLQPKPHFCVVCAQYCQWAGGKTCWPSTFWGLFLTELLFRSSFEEVAAAN